MKSKKVMGLVCSSTVGATILCVLVLTSNFVFEHRIIDPMADASDEKFIPSVMRYAHIPGLAMVTVRSGRIDRMSTYGFADIEKGVSVHDETLFNIASISKPLLGILLLEAERTGALSLDTNINDYLPLKIDNPHVSAEIITLRDIATHTSGIADYFNYDFYCFGQDCKEDLGSYLHRLLDSEGDLYQSGRHYLPHKPGEHWEYSNLATAVAGYILERQMGKSLDALSKELIFNRMFQQPASWRLDGLSPESIAVQYEVEPCTSLISICFNPQSESALARKLEKYLRHRTPQVRFRPYPAFGNPQYPDGGIRTNILALGNLIESLISNRGVGEEPLLDQSVYKAMFADQLDENVQEGQRFFWRQNDGGLMTDEYIGHIGGDYGLFTALYFNVNEGDGFAVMMNRGIDDLSWKAMEMITQRYKDGRL